MPASLLVAVPLCRRVPQPNWTTVLLPLSPLPHLLKGIPRPPLPPLLQNGHGHPSSSQCFPHLHLCAIPFPCPPLLASLFLLPLPSLHHHLRTHLCHPHLLTVLLFIHSHLRLIPGQRQYTMSHTLHLLGLGAMAPTALHHACLWCTSSASASHTTRLLTMIERPHTHCRKGYWRCRKGGQTCAVWPYARCGNWCVA